MDALQRTGNYAHRNDDKFVKQFENGRAFTILVASAFATGSGMGGFYASEKNGIAILDDDNKSVVLDEHLRSPNGVSHAHYREASRILAMPWEEFRKFCKSNPLYRNGSVPDIDERNPVAPPLPEPDRRIVSDSSVIPPDAIGGTVLLRDRNAIIDFLRKHPVHCDPNRPWHIAWNIKLHRPIDVCAKPEDFAGELLAEHDEAWRRKCEDSSVVFDEACQQALAEYLGGDYCTHPGDDQGEYGFRVEGRSGGWLALRSVEGIEGGLLEFGSQRDLKQALLDLPDESLCKLYRVVASVDHDVERRYELVEYQVASLRAAWESEQAFEAPSPSA